MNDATGAVRHLELVSEHLREKLPRHIQQVATEAVTRMRKSMPHYPLTSPSVPSQRGGNLANALNVMVKEEQSGKSSRRIEARFGVNQSNRKASITAAVQEFGKRNVRAKLADKLLIPIGPLRNAQGQALVGGMRGIKPFWDIAILPEIVLGRRKGTQDEMVPIALRKESIDIKARPFARPQVDWAFAKIGKMIGAVVAYGA